jgi:Mn-containing catalase
LIVVPVEQKQKDQQSAKCWKQQFGGGWGRRRTSKQYLAGLWSISDSELSQEINDQNGTCHCGLQKFGCEKLALKLDSF